MMSDRQKVLKGLMCCTNGENNVPRCEECPYADEQGTCEKLDELHRDALELLKAQEPMPCGEKIKAGDIMLDFYECGYCKNAIRKPWKYCPFCGKAVHWNGN